MAKPYIVEKEFNGVNYKFQFNGLSAYMQALDESYVDGTSNTSVVKLNEYILDNVVVEPKGLKIDDFDNAKELSEITAFARKVMQGLVKPEDKPVADKK